MKRIVLLVTVAAIMAVMLVASAAPAAFAAPGDICPGKNWLIVGVGSPRSDGDANANGTVCLNRNSGHTKDDRATI
jgi:hypothetical protein